MKKLAFIAVMLLAGSCNKPSAGDCRKAIEKIRELTGTAKIEGTSDIEAAIRSCRGNASKKSVQCAMDASSLEQLERCGLLTAEEIKELTQ